MNCHAQCSAIVPSNSSKTGWKVELTIGAQNTMIILLVASCSTLLIREDVGISGFQGQAGLKGGYVHCCSQIGLPFWCRRSDCRLEPITLIIVVEIAGQSLQWNSDFAQLKHKWAEGPMWFETFRITNQKGASQALPWSK